MLKRELTEDPKMEEGVSHGRAKCTIVLPESPGFEATVDTGTREDLCESELQTLNGSLK